MNKGTVTKLKNWLVANFNIKLVESSSTDSFYLTNDSVSIRISDHIQGSDFNKIRFDISIILPKACELANIYWNSHTREWEYNGKKYKALSKEDRELYCPNIRPKAHKFKSKEVGYRPTFWIGLYQNRIVWYTIFPEGCVILKFHSIDKEPTISSDWIGYVSENGIQPILDCETNEFL